MNTNQIEELIDINKEEEEKEKEKEKDKDKEQFIKIILASSQ